MRIQLAFNYNRAIVYAQSNNIDLVLQDLQTAINLDAEYRQRTKTDVVFDSIRNNAQFQILIHQK
ncbi:TPR end-of-group domain-containing protein [Calothrix sp. UHCC 0171]|uniref:TPR end-of-group domain-containing protein n=1 Tax=Calothrix sp. UHCC 0171 TaxID=3110245 RepID=UPI002B22140B|nr:hypothetical protein [Calothrix sp. UHCC 0171]MEA5572094.1 hypothetical protein [Calothrix sp. UHCC 0171]